MVSQSDAGNQTFSVRQILFSGIVPAEGRAHKGFFAAKN
jgi:hypothetical protein